MIMFNTSSVEDIEGKWIDLISSEYYIFVHPAQSLWHRRELRSVKGCISSVYGYLHNETVNIHSHLGGAVLFSFLALFTHPYVLAVHRSVTWKDVTGMYIFIGAAVFCLLSSATYHCLTCHSRDVSKRCNALDYTGIVGEGLILCVCVIYKLIENHLSPHSGVRNIWIINYFWLHF